MNPPPLNYTHTAWEEFVNYTLLFDEFRSPAYSEVPVEQAGDFTVVESRFDKSHPDFFRAKQIGETMSLTWATKLKQDFPSYRFRVYYLHYDSTRLRFHRVRVNEDLWRTDDDFRLARHPSFEDAILYDTDYLDKPVLNLAVSQARLQ